jgi:deoxyadenosine/deoxycytidine kinase
MVKALKIGVVGTCGTGKSELVARLINRGFDAHHIAQEHSYMPKMWQIVTNPDILIYLQVSFTETLRRKNFAFSLEEYRDQLHRLRHAVAHADISIDTDVLTPKGVFESVLSELSDF